MTVPIGLPSSGAPIDAKELLALTRTARPSAHQLVGGLRSHGNAGPELSVIVPTFNEAANVGALVEALDTALAGIAWEVIIVDDDSPDGTSALAKAFARSDHRIRCIRRVGRRGLAGACIEGILSSSSPFVAVLDGDLQHDERILSAMLNRLQNGPHSLVVGTRHEDGGSSAALTGARGRLSQLGRALSRMILRHRTSDPMSGYFMARRELVEDLAPNLSAEGFKILADILASAPSSLGVTEIGYTFRARQAGASKLGPSVLIDYLGILLHHMTRGLLPVRFVMFGMVGTTGLAIHLATLNAMMTFEASIDFAVAELLATLVAMASNFLLNNELTYRDRRHRGRAMIPAFLLFAMLCSVGTLTNVGIASWIYGRHSGWWLAGLAGAVTGAFWNYAASTGVVWKQRRSAGPTISVAALTQPIDRPACGG